MIDAMRFPLLMGSLGKTGGHLVKNAGHLAKCSVTLANCECLNGSGGSVLTTTQAQVDITGSAASCNKTIPFCSGSFTGYDFTGSWVVPCNSIVAWYKYQYLCTPTGEDFYSLEQLILELRIPSTSPADPLRKRLVMRLISGEVNATAGSTAPVDDLPPPSGFTSVPSNERRWTWDDLSIADGVRACVTTMPSPTVANFPLNSLATCDYSSYTAAASLVNV